MRSRFTHIVLVGILFIVCGGTSYALPMTYTNSTDFFNDLTTAGLRTSTLDFDTLPYGHIIASGDTVNGITFNYDFGGVQMMVSDIFDTTSPVNFLGTDDGDVFLDGDNFDLSFSASHAIGMYFLTADLMFDNDIMLTAGGATAGLIAGDVQQTLADGSDVFFLGIIDNSRTFTSVDISTIGGGYFLYSVDDIVTTVPEPGILQLLAIGLAGLLTFRKRRQAVISLLSGDKS